jgi:hypothetical protein
VRLRLEAEFDSPGIDEAFRMLSEHFRALADGEDDLEGVFGPPAHFRIHRVREEDPSLREAFEALETADRILLTVEAAPGRVDPDGVAEARGLVRRAALMFKRGEERARA